MYKNLKYSTKILLEINHNNKVVNSIYKYFVLFLYAKHELEGFQIKKCPGKGVVTITEKSPL